MLLLVAAARISVSRHVLLLVADAEYLCHVLLLVTDAEYLCPVTCCYWLLMLNICVMSGVAIGCWC